MRSSMRKTYVTRITIKKVSYKFNKRFSNIKLTGKHPLIKLIKALWVLYY